MLKQNFIDYVKICCRSGKGGGGSTHLHRSRTNPRGGPDGGDGGRGGHVFLKGNRNLWTLLHLKYRKHVIAGHGNNGSGDHKTGAQGDDIILEVPLGTQAFNADTGAFEFEITQHEEKRILVAGGRGGLGNAHFKSPTNQTPRYAQPGEEGKEEWKVLELKVLADVGLVGFPNAGKSTLLSVLSAAKPKIGDYPFTTLTPNLGIVKYRDHRSFVMADIPGIIEGAHEGKGLGLQFLKHIERNSMLLFMIACDADDINDEYYVLRSELEKHNPELMHKTHVLAITKADILDEELEKAIAETITVEVPYLFISAINGKGIQSLKDVIWQHLNNSLNEI